MSITYNVDETRGLLLMKALGTFYTKYYPHKTFVRSVCEGYEELATQLEQDLLEIQQSASFEDCPLTHKERFKLIPLDTPETLFLADEDSSLVADEAFPVVGTALADLRGYKIDDTIVDIEYLTDKIIDPTITLVKNVDFVVLKGVLYIPSNKLPEGTTQLWGVNLLSNIDYFYNTIGFLFFDKKDIHKLPNIKLVTTVLLKLLRYGLYEKPLLQFFTLFFGLPFCKTEGETVINIFEEEIVTTDNTYTIPTNTSPIVSKGQILSFLDPLTNGVKIKDAAREQYYVKNGKVYIHDYKLVPMKWNHFKWGPSAILNAEYYVEDSYKEGLLHDAVYRVDVKVQPSQYPAKYLEILKKITPVWLTLNVILEQPVLEEEYGEVDEEIKHADYGVFIESEYGSVSDGSLRTVTWNGTNLDGTPLSWDNFSWNEKKLINEIQVYHQQHE